MQLRKHFILRLYIYRVLIAMLTSTDDDWCCEPNDPRDGYPCDPCEAEGTWQDVNAMTLNWTDDESHARERCAVMTRAGLDAALCTQDHFFICKRGLVGIQLTAGLANPSIILPTTVSLQNITWTCNLRIFLGRLENIYILH